MVTIVKNGNTLAYGIKHYIVDAEADIAALNLSEMKMGSTIFVIDTSNQYMINSKGEMKKITSAYNPGGGGGGTSGSDVIYDGGEE